MKRKNLFLSLVILAAGGLTSCNGLDFLSNDTTTTTTTDSGKDTKTDNTTEQEKENTGSEDKESKTDESDEGDNQGEDEKDPEPEPEPEPPITDEKKLKLINDTRILNSRGVGFTYLDYDLNEQYKSWDKLIEDKNIVLNSSGKVSTIETDDLGKGVLDLPSNVSIDEDNTKVDNDLIDSVVLGGTTW